MSFLDDLRKKTKKGLRNIFDEDDKDGKKKPNFQPISGEPAYVAPPNFEKNNRPTLLEREKSEKRNVNPLNIRPVNDVNPLNIKPQNKVSPFNIEPVNKVSPMRPKNIPFMTDEGRERAEKIGKLPFKLAKTIAQGTARSGGAVALSALGKDNFQPTEGTFERKAKDFVFGSEPLRSIGGEQKDWSRTLQDLGVSESKAKPISFIGAPLLIAADFTGGGKGKFLKTIAKSNKADDIAKILKTQFRASDDLAAATASKLKNVTDEKQVAKIISDDFAEAGAKLPRGAGKIKRQAGKAGKVDEVATTPSPKKPPKIEDMKNTAKAADESKDPLINLEHLNISQKSKDKTEDVIESIRPELEAVKGEKMTNKEVMEAAKESEILRRATSRDQVLKENAAIMRTRQHLAALAEQNEVTPEFIDTLKVLSAEASKRGRQLQVLGANADPSLNSVKTKIVKELIKIGKTTDEIAEAAKGIDFDNPKQVTEFYRKLVKPTLPELIEEYRYINMLSSPKTHIVNAFSNMIQGSILAPATRLFSGGVDFIASKLTGKARKHYIKEVPAYYRGFFGSFGDAVEGAFDVMRGRKFVERPDVRHIPTGSKILKPGQIVPRALEAGDIFFRTMIKAGEQEALAYKIIKQGKPLNDAVKARIAKEAGDKAQYYVFRKALDPSNKTGQGEVLSYIDKLTSTVYQLRNIPGVRWFIPFVQTPMNILKQGVEYSPLGFSTMAGATNKTEQFGKALMGSMVFSGASMLAWNDMTTWEAPTSEKEKEAFYASGRQPYSIKVGDKWVSYSRIGPLAYPIALASAMKWYISENPKAATKSNLEKATEVLSATAGFFTDQSYMQGLGDFVDFARGDEYALSRAASNIPSQLIPLASLQRWTAQFIDPVFRKGSSDLTPEGIAQNLMKGIPGLSKNVEPYTDPTGAPSERDMLIFNSLSPLASGEVSPEFEDYYQNILKARREDALSTEEKEQMDEKADSVFEELKKLNTIEQNKRLLQLRSEDSEMFNEVYDRIQKDRLGLDYKDDFLKSLGVEDGQRARFVDEQLQKIEDPTERQKYFMSLVRKKIITPEVNKQIWRIRFNRAQQ